MALAIALDSNRYVDFRRNDTTAVEILTTADRIVLPFVVLGELRAGFRGGARLAANERDLATFLQRSRVEVAFADEATTHLYADLLVGLHQAGTPIPTNDIWIAALTIQHDLVLFTRDKHFDHVPRLARV